MLIVDPSYEILGEMDSASLVERVEACGRICYKSEDKITPASAIPFVQKMVVHGHNSVMEMAAITLRFECGTEAVADFFACQPKYFAVNVVDGGLLVSGSIRAFREFYSLYSENPIICSALVLLAEKEPYLFSDIWGADASYSGDVKASKLSLAEVDALPAALLLAHRFVAVRFVVNRAVTHELVRHRPCSYLQESQRYCRYSNEKFGNQVSFVRPLFFEEGTPEYEAWNEAMEETEKLYLQLLKTSTPQAARTVLPNSCKTEIIAFCSLSEWGHIFSLRTTTHVEPSMREVMIPLEVEMKGQFPALDY
ncbi:FAD-dependent thymidylate synthase [Desulfotalea psychrophila]|nr:FAD-dependent thymidylate synthase [Desulfotalea psychrophila]